MAASDYEVFDERFRSCVNRTSHVERLWTGARWTEGPVYFPAGRYVLFSDIPNDRIMRYDETDGSVSVFRTPCGYANGHTVDRQGRLVSCEHGNRRVTRTEIDGRITVIADNYQGKRLNSPNDVVVKSDDSIWFTDPPYGIMSDYEGNKATPEIGNNVFRVDGKTGEIKIVVDDFIRPNGLAFSPDERYLYANGSRNKYIRRYDVKPDGTLTNSQMFIDMTTDSAPGITDGMKVDSKGNVYSSGPGGIWVIAPDGKHLGTIRTPESVTNLAFGDADRKTLYITARHTIYKIRIKEPGG